MNTKRGRFCWLRGRNEADRYVSAFFTEAASFTKNGLPEVVCPSSMLRYTYASQSLSARKPHYRSSRLDDPSLNCFIFADQWYDDIPSVSTNPCCTLPLKRQVEANTVVVIQERQ